MFDERRQKAGIDRSYPLEPLKGSKSGTRGGSVERMNKTVVKSTIQKNVSLRNGKQIVNNKQAVHSVYNNNNGDETYEEHRYENDNLNKTYNKSRDIIEMLNNHNLNDSLENEQMPEIGFDEPDEPYFTGKLVNLGGKLPSENVKNEKKTTNKSSTLGKTFRKESKVRLFAVVFRYRFYCDHYIFTFKVKQKEKTNSSLL